MITIIALGNPGEKYAATRHNVGWRAVDLCLQAWNFPSLVSERSLSGRVTEGSVGAQYLKVLYPDTYMNNSGSAVMKFVPPNEVQQLIVVHDDIDLPLGEIKVGKGRGAGGNNGVGSIITKFGTKDFIRVRIGIAPKSFWTGKTKRPRGGGPLEQFVLKPFTKGEQQQLPEMFAKVRTAIELILGEGVEKAMNQCN